MKEEYKGYTIEYSEYGLMFVAKIGDSGYSNTDLIKVRKHIDNLEKKDFKRFDVFIRSGWHNSSWKVVTVTSLFMDCSVLSVWGVDKDKSRSKYSFNELFEISEENLSKIKTMKELQARNDEIEKEIDTVFSSMKKQDAPILEEVSKTSDNSANVETAE